MILKKLLLSFLILFMSVSFSFSEGIAINGGGLRSTANSFQADFLLRVALGQIPGYSHINKYGHNPVVEVATDPEDVWGGGGIYNFYFTTNQTVEAVSTDIDDVGSLVSSGTATGGSLTTIEDSGATFVSDGVAVGDVVINDTNGEWGSVNVVTSETELACTIMTNASTVSRASNANKSGDTYRIASSGDTGAGVIHSEGLTANGLIWTVATETTILNGQTDVALSTGFVRMYRSSVLHAGASAMNEGDISIEVDATTNAGIFITTGDGRTQQANMTVPSGMTGIFIKGYVGISSGGNPASPAAAIFTWRARLNNGATGILAVNGQIEVIANGGQFWIYEYGVPVPIPEKSDMKIICDEVSSIVGVIGAFDMIFVDNNFL